MKITSFNQLNIKKEGQNFAANSLSCSRNNTLERDVFLKQETKKKNKIKIFIDKFKNFFKTKEIKNNKDVNSEISFGSRIDFSKLPYFFKNTETVNNFGQDIVKKKIVFHEKPKSFKELCRVIMPEGSAIFVNRKNCIDIDTIEHARIAVASRKISEYAKALETDIDSVVKMLKSTKKQSLIDIAKEIEDKESLNAKVNFIFAKDKEIVSALNTKTNIRFANIKEYIRRANLNKKYWQDKREHLKFDEPEVFQKTTKLKDRKGKPSSSDAVFFPENGKMLLYTPNSKIDDSVEVTLPNLVGYNDIVKKYDFLDSDINLNNIDESSYRAIHSMHRLFERFSFDEQGVQDYKRVDDVLKKIKQAIEENGDDLYSGMPKDKSSRVGLYINSGKVCKDSVGMILPNEKTDGFINVVFDKEGKIVTLFDVTTENIYDNFCPILMKDKNYTSEVFN